MAAETQTSVTQTSVAERESTAASPELTPLCVDLDGSLVKSDTLVDSILALVRHHPAYALRLPGWLAKGKAGFKAEVGRHVTLDVEHLPYNRPLLAALRHEHAAGRSIYLATGADSTLANRVAQHLGIFSAVFASDGKANVTGHRKLQLLNDKFGPTGFDYIGNSATDLPLLKAARTPSLANPHAGLAARLRHANHPAPHVFADRASLTRTVSKAIRVQQWAKNILLFAPLVLAHAYSDRTRLVHTLLAFAAFCLAASATYVVNDLLDIEADRRHAHKRNRPFAAGDLPASTGIAIVLLFLALAAVLSYFEPHAFAFWMGVYFVTTIAYSFYFKRVPLVDVLVLAGLYTVRILAGGAAAEVSISPWLGGFSLFFFLSLAVVKRYSELHNLQQRGAIPANGRGYLLSDLDLLRSFGIASGYASVVVFTLYINSPAVTELYPHYQRLWLLAPVLIFWISRIWLLAGRGQMDEDPVIYAITDRVSLLLGVLTVLVLLGSIL
jgi:4-hydroxybenzoate polyprenyltransferase